MKMKKTTICLVLTFVLLASFSTSIFVTNYVAVDDEIIQDTLVSTVDAETAKKLKDTAQRLRYHRAVFTLLLDYYDGKVDLPFETDSESLFRAFAEQLEIVGMDSYDGIGIVASADGWNFRKQLRVRNNTEAGTDFPITVQVYYRDIDDVMIGWDAQEVIDLFERLRFEPLNVRTEPAWLRNFFRTSDSESAWGDRPNPVIQPNDYWWREGDNPNPVVDWRTWWSD